MKKSLFLSIKGLCRFFPARLYAPHRVKRDFYVCFLPTLSSTGRGADVVMKRKKWTTNTVKQSPLSYPPARLVLAGLMDGLGLSLSLSLSFLLSETEVSASRKQSFLSAAKQGGSGSVPLRQAERKLSHGAHRPDAQPHQGSI